MERLLDLLGMTGGAWIGWAVGSSISFFVGFLGSVIGTALGMYLIRRATGPLRP